MSKRLTKVLSLILTLVMFLSVSTPAFAWGGGELGDGWDREIGEDDLRPFDDYDPELDGIEDYDYFQALSEDGRIQVTVEAPMGSLPSLAEIHIEPVDAEDIREAVEEVVEGEPDILLAMDISFWLDDYELEPEEPVKVKITAEELLDRKNLTVVHIPDNEEPEAVRLVPSSELGFEVGVNEVAFEAKSFSVYAVVGEDDTSEDARVTVNFYNTHLTGDTLLATVYVKNGDDAAAIDKIVYDPGIGEVFDTPETKDLAFMGWSLDVRGVKSREGMDNSAYPGADYNSKTTPMTVAQIKTFLEGLDITEGDVINVYAIIFQRLTVTYIGANAGISLGSVAVLRSLNDATVDYEVNMAFTAGAEQFFEGWMIYDAAEKAHIEKAVYQETEIAKPYAASTETDPTIFPNKTVLTLNGDLTLSVSTPDGHWLVFHENGKGATYNAPMFIKDGEQVVMPANSTPERMTRNGYTFGGWYKDAACTAGNEFTGDGQTLSVNTDIYAKWIPKTTANYTILVWLQNLNGVSYDFAATDTIEGAQANSTVSVVGTVGGTTATVGPKTYTAPEGFKLGESDQNVKIVPENTAVVNVYFDREEYTLSFRAQNPVIYTESDANNANYGLVNGEYVPLTLVDGVWMYETDEYTESYTVATDNSGTQYVKIGDEYIELIRSNGYWYYAVGSANNGQSSDVTYNSGTTYYYNQYEQYTGSYSFAQLYYYLDAWRAGLASGFTGTIYVRHTGTRYKITRTPILAEYEGTRYTRQQQSGWQPIKTITALYGQVISDQFPIYGDDGVYYNQGQRWRAQAPTHGFDQVIVLIDTMPAADIVFNLDTGTGQEAGATLNYYVEALPGATNTRTFEGTKYVLYTEKPIEANYNFVTVEDYLELSGFTKKAVADASGTHLVEVGTAKRYRTSANSNTDVLDVYFYYSRNKANILYRDGAYVDGKDGVTPLEGYESRGTLKTVMDIPFGSDLSSYEKGGTNYFAPTYEDGGFAFAGWYWDEACTQPASFTTLPQGGMNVFAKWVQVQFRLFLHPNVPNTDKSLYWGKDDQAMCFRISNGAYASLPDGTRADFEFVGWYLDNGTFDQVFNADIVALTTGNVTTPYDKSTDMTDVMNKYGEIVPVGGKLDNGQTNQTQPYNSDLIGYDHDGNTSTPGIDRFWITKRFDVYAKWKAKLNGAKGIDIIYDAGDGTTPPHDNLQYEDNTKAVAEAASTPPAPDAETGRAYQFLYWKVLKWSETDNAFVDSGEIAYPGGNFLVLKANAHEEDYTDPTDPAITKKYTIKLVAEYGFVDAPAPTYITWYSNVYDAAGNPIPEAESKLTVKDPSTEEMRYEPYQDGAFVEGKGKGFTREDVQINKAVLIPPADTFKMEGYTFLGWGRVDKQQTTEGGESAEPGRGASGISKPEDLSETNLFLKWVPGENGQAGHYEAELPVAAEAPSGNVATLNLRAGESELSWQEVRFVAADEDNPYQDLYAVWGGEFYVYHSGLTGADALETVQITRATGSYDLTQHLGGAGLNRAGTVANVLYGGYYLKGGFTAPQEVDGKIPAYNGSNWTWTTAQVTPGNQIKPEGGVTYYVKEVPADKYLQPYFHYSYKLGTGEIRNAWLISDVDDSNYQQTGFILQTDNQEAVMVNSLTVTSEKSGTSITLTAKRVFRATGALTYWEAMNTYEPNAGFGPGVKVLQYWVTPDNLLVNGIKARTYGDLSNVSSFTGENLANNLSEVTVASEIKLFEQTEETP